MNAPTTLMRVAIVDDEEAVRKALGRLLRSSGLDAETFPTGRAFLESLADVRPDCLVLDLHMPGLTGLQVLQKLQLSPPMLPVIVITGQDEPENRSRCLAAGAAAYLRKPLDDELLLKTIDRAVRRDPS
jgi:FixJ family two-component response regulator